MPTLQIPKDLMHENACGGTESLCGSQRRVEIMAPYPQQVSAWAGEAGPHPLHKVGFCNFTGSQTQHCLHSLVRLRLLELVPVSLDEFNHREPRCALVAIGQRMILCQAGSQQTSLLS